VSELGRRQLLAGLGASLFACRRTPVPVEADPPPVPPIPVHLAPDGGAEPLGFVRRELALPGTASPRTIVLEPRVPAGSTEKFPVVIALHGRGEARRGPSRGPQGWPDDYALELALDRIAHPPLDRDDFFGLVTPAELAAHNEALKHQPYRGVVVLCPYVPDLDLASRAAQDEYGRFLVDVLLPRARETAPILHGRAHTGIDGISLGGEVALHVGAGFAEAFGAVGGMQPAIQSKDAREWAERLVAAKARAGALAVHLLTSTGDPFRKPTRRLSEELDKAGFLHRFEETPGPHDYVYNRGPAAYGMLSFHDRALRP